MRHSDAKVWIQHGEDIAAGGNYLIDLKVDLPFTDN
jgi:hypothetical protein